MLIVDKLASLMLAVSLFDPYPRVLEPLLEFHGCQPLSLALEHALGIQIYGKLILFQVFQMSHRLTNQMSYDLASISSRLIDKATGRKTI